MRARHLRAAILGLTLGIALSRIGFGDFGEVHRMFLFADLRLFSTFAGAVALTMIGLRAFGRDRSFAPRRIHPGTIAGGVLFGVGWALCGACPAIVLVQLGSGYLPAIVTTVGMVVGVRIYPAIHRRLFSWDQGSCSG
jgi:uncharacterized protein